MVSWSALLLLLPLVSASALQHRATTVCGTFDTVPAGSYTLLTDLWGKTDKTPGSQCSTLDSVNGNTVAWSTTWNWSGNGIKSFSNIQLNTGINVQLSKITKMPSTWHWSQSNTAVSADVSYDLFTSDTPGGKAANEIMIWLANFDSGPASFHYDSKGNAIPVATNVAIAGHTWNFYSGTNTANNVFSFIPVSGTITSFSGDIHPFFTYLIDHGYFASSQYLTTAQAGTEATSGSATFKTSAYSLSIN